MAEMRLIVSGAAGRMGRMVVRTIHESDGFKLAGALERDDSPWLGQDPALLAGCPASGLEIVADPCPCCSAPMRSSISRCRRRASRSPASPRRRASST